MLKENWIRARNANQKQARENAILASAMKLFLTHSYHEVTLAKIAADVGITRTTIYLYFKTREEIFLASYLREIDCWVEDIVQTFRGEISLKRFVDQWSELIAGHDSLVRLTPLFATSIENNTSPQVLSQAKLKINNKMKTVSSVLVEAVPTIGFDEWMTFFVLHQALIAGLWPMTDHSQPTIETLERLSLDTGIVEFGSFYKQSIRYYLVGVAAEHR